MLSPNSADKSSDESSFEYERKIEKDIEYVKQIQRLFKQKFELFLSEITANDMLILIKPIYVIKIKSERIEKKTNLIEQKLKNKQEIIRTNQLDSHSLLNDIEQLRKDLTKLELRLEQMNNDYQKRIPTQEQPNTNDMKHSSNNQSETIKSSESSPRSLKTKRSIRSVVDTLKNSISQKSDDTPTLTRLIKQMNAAMLDNNGNHLVQTESNNEMDIQEEDDDDDDEEDDEEIIVFLDFNSMSKIDQKIRLSNNVVRWLKGPIKVMLDGTMHVFDVCAQGTHISEDALKAVKQGLDKQKQIGNDSIKTTFTEITSDWKYEGENSDRGFTSPSIWMRDPQGKRILIKTQDHPLSAANEWLAYVLGRFLALPVNEVQISTYENELVTLHTDVTNENEKVITFMDLPKERRKTILTTPIMECMDLFDHIIQNVDRNQRNILITMSKTDDINDDNVKLKIYLIDHSNCFGMGKLNGLSVVASKFHTNHLAVVKFDPIRKSKQFEKYLNKLPVQDRPLISKTLNRFSSITDEQFDCWINEIQDLLSTSQYNRIHGVLRRQRDIAKRYTIQWGISPRSSTEKSNETKQRTSETSNMTTTYL